MVLNCREDDVQMTLIRFTCAETVGYKSMHAATAVYETEDEFGRLQNTSCTHGGITGCVAGWALLHAEWKYPWPPSCHPPAVILRLHGGIFCRSAAALLSAPP